MAETRKGGGIYMLRLTMILFAVTAITALLLSFVNYITEDKIDAINNQKTQDAMSAVMPGEYNFEELQGDWTSPVTAIYAAQNGEETFGWVVQVSPNGFGGEINMVVGIDSNHTVTGVSITEMSETSGLGTNANRESWREQFIGKSGQLAVDKDGGEINSLTGATVTSRAVTSGVNAALDAVAALG